MPEEEDQNMNTNPEEEEEDIDDEEEDEGFEEDEDMEEYDEDEDLELDSPTPSTDPIPTQTQRPSIPNVTTTTRVVPISVPTTTTPAIATTITTTQTGGEPDMKRQKVEEPVTPLAMTTASEERKPLSIDESSRKLFQRLWTDEDEIGLLQGFLEYNTKQRGTKNSSSYHHDTGPFYDQIRTKLQLEFNKNQLVEKLRRLKKKYRNVISRIGSGKKDLVFKTPHDQSCFEISKKIWGGDNVVVSGGGVEEEDGNPNPLQIVELKKETTVGGNRGVAVEINGLEKKAATAPRSRKRIRKRAEEPPSVSNPSNLSNNPVNLSISSVIEETVKSCLSPLFKELLQSAINGPNNVRGLGVMGFNPLNFGANSSSSSMNLLSGEMVDEKWKQQQVLELEVYAKRMDLVQDQIKLALAELRSAGN
ncbi:hypothetical protein MKW94_002715 [Papaver nudicaule]|uniref:Glabrous enhancer-binding protein-like DBD domain-containing protein n=1 Tax=Papaver nudicaule TaxID=74823 RepID=A0AA41VW23_PAPNU|nr:hypothetical protein [Papaver nudicaule]